MSSLSNFKLELLGFVNDIIKPVYNNFIAIGSFIYLVVQLIAIFLGKKIIVPEEYRLQTIWIALALIIVSFIYYLMLSTLQKIKTKFQDAENRIKNESKQLQAQLEQLTNELKNLDVKDPNNPIEKNLTYQDVEFAIYCLTKKIADSSFLDKNTSGKYDFKKNVIIGVDRGGAILGGMLAKNFGLATKTLAVFYANPPQPPNRHGKETSITAGKCLDNIDFDKVTKILLVDDVIRTGESMMAAYDMLNQILSQKKNSNQIKIEIACILYEKQSRELLNVEHFVFVYKTDRLNIKLPWDEMHVYENMLLEENKKKDFEKLCVKIQ